MSLVASYEGDDLEMVQNEAAMTVVSGSWGEKTVAWAGTIAVGTKRSGRLQEIFWK